MDGYTGADIASLSSAAVMLALREHVSKYEDPKEADSHIRDLKIHMKHFGSYEKDKTIIKSRAKYV